MHFLIQWINSQFVIIVLFLHKVVKLWDLLDIVVLSKLFRIDTGSFTAGALVVFTRFRCSQSNVSKQVIMIR